MYIEFDILVALFLKPCKWMFVELGYLVPHESHFQSLSIGIKYIVLECLYTIPHIKCIPEACGFLKWQKTRSCCSFFLNNATMCWTRNGAVEHLSGYSYQLYQWCFFYRSTFVGSACSFGFFIPTTTANDLRLRRIFYPRCYPFIFLS